MTKDEIQKALNEIPKDGNYDAEYLLEWFYYHQKTVICALQSQLTKTEENVTCGGLSNIPEGWQLVPKEPTDDMYRLADESFWARSGKVYFRDIYKAMLSAAPKHPQERKTK